MRPWTDGMPKPMIPVAGKPLLEHQLEWLARSGVSEVFMGLGYKAQAVMDHFGDGKPWGLRVDYHVEESPRGTAGCVRDIWPAIRHEALIVYGDMFLSIDLSALLRQHHRLGAAATLVLAQTDHPEDSDLVSLEGDLITGFYRGCVPSGERRTSGAFGDRSPLAAAATWVVTDRIMDRVPADRPSDFGRDIFPQALAAGERLAGFQTRDTIADLGTPQRLEAFVKRAGGMTP